MWDSVFIKFPWTVSHENKIRQNIITWKCRDYKWTLWCCSSSWVRSALFKLYLFFAKENVPLYSRVAAVTFLFTCTKTFLYSGWTNVFSVLSEEWVKRTSLYQVYFISSVFTGFSELPVSSRNFNIADKRDKIDKIYCFYMKSGTVAVTQRTETVDLLHYSFCVLEMLFSLLKKNIFSKARPSSHLWYAERWYSFVQTAHISLSL